MTPQSIFSYRPFDSTVVKILNRCESTVVAHVCRAVSGGPHSDPFDSTHLSHFPHPLRLWSKVFAHVCRAVSGRPHLSDSPAGGIFHITRTPETSTCPGAHHSAHTAEAAGAHTLFIRTATERLGFVVFAVSY